MVIAVGNGFDKEIKTRTRLFAFHMALFLKTESVIAIQTAF